MAWWTKKAKTPTYPNDTSKDDQDILKQARERWEAGMEHDGQNIKDAHEDLKFIAVSQWDEDIKRERETDGRPVMTQNMLPKFIAQITGDMRMNNPAIKVRGAGAGSDQEIAEIYTGMIRNIEALSDARTTYVRGGEAAARSGLGAWCLETCYADDESFDQEIRIRYIPNSLNVLFDPDAKELTREDAMWAFYTESLTYDAFKARWPEAKISSWEDAGRLGFDQEWYGPDTCMVAWYYVRKPEIKKIGLSDDGETVDLSEQGSAVKDYKKTREVTTYKVYQYVLSAAEILEGPNEWAGKYIPLVPVIGVEVNIGDRVVRHGAIRWAKDPQRMFNYHVSTAVETDALSPKAPFVVTDTNVEGREAMWALANRKNLPYLVHTPDSRNGGIPPQRQSASSDISTSMALAANARDGLFETIGIYPPALGKQGNEQSGKAVIARQKESDVGTYVYIDNLAKAIAHTGRILVDLIPKIYDTPRIVRILAEDGTENMVEVNQIIAGTEQIKNDLSAGKYDVVVETGPSFSTKRAEAAQAMQEFAGYNPDGAKLVMDLIAEAQDWPNAKKFAERFKMALPPGIDMEVDAFRQQMMANQPPPPPDPLVMAEQRKAEAEILKAQNAARELDLKEREASREDAVAQSSMMLDQAEQARKNMETRLEAERVALQRREMELTHRESVAKIQSDGLAAMPEGSGLPLLAAVDQMTQAINRLNQPTRTTIVVDGKLYQAVKQPNGQVAISVDGNVYTGSSQPIPN